VLRGVRYTQDKDGIEPQEYLHGSLFYFEAVGTVTFAPGMNYWRPQ
jgi:hypothetical protein